MEDSVNSSELAARNFTEQEETSTLMETEPTSPEWTDEKHCLFLKNMETTFVNQLYKSIDLSGKRSYKSCTSGSESFKHKQMSMCAPSAQFKVLRNGFWSKVDFQRDEPKDNQKEDFKDPLPNPWIQHYRKSKVQAIRKFPASCAKAPLATTQNQNPTNKLQPWCQDSIGCNTEVTDQNFNDEALEEEKSNMIHNMKRTRTTDITSSNDHVVPYNTVEADDTVEGNVRVPPQD